jgi:hypothetical protein
MRPLPRLLFALLLPLFLGGNALVAQDQEVYAAKLDAKAALGDRDWTPLTEIAPLLDADGRKQIQDALETARREADLHFIVITVRAADLQKYGTVAVALMKEQLSAKEGGVLVISEQPGVQISGYTVLLQVRVNQEPLQKLDRMAMEHGTTNLSASGYITTFATTILSELTRHKKEARAGVKNQAADSLVPTGLNLLKEEEPAAKTPPPAAVAAVSTNPAPVTATPAPTPAPIEEEPQTIPTSTPSGLPWGPLYAIVTLIVICATLIGWISGRAKSQRGRKEQRPPSGLAPQPRRAPTPAPQAAEPETMPTPKALSTPSYVTAPPAAVKPRVIESRPARQRRQGSMAHREDAQPLVEHLAALAEANRRKSVNEPFDPDAELDNSTLQEVLLHYRALFKMVPPASRPALSESVDKLVSTLTGTRQDVF